MWLIAGLLGATLGYFVGWFFNFWEFVNWILALFGFIIGYVIGKEIQERSEIADYILERECPTCPNCKVRGGIEIKETKTLSRDKFTNTTRSRYKDGGGHSTKELWYVGEEQVFFKCNKCAHEYSEIKPYKRQIF